MEKSVIKNVYTFKLFGIKIFEFTSDYVGYEYKQKFIPDRITEADYMLLEEYRIRENQKKNEKRFWRRKKD